MKKVMALLILLSSIAAAQSGTVTVYALAACDQYAGDHQTSGCFIMRGPDFRFRSADDCEATRRDYAEVADNKPTHVRTYRCVSREISTWEPVR